MILVEVVIVRWRIRWGCCSGKLGIGAWMILLLLFGSNSRINNFHIRTQWLSVPCPTNSLITGILGIGIINNWLISVERWLAILAWSGASNSLRSWATSHIFLNLIGRVPPLSRRLLSRCSLLLSYFRLRGGKMRRSLISTHRTRSPWRLARWIDILWNTCQHISIAEVMLACRVCHLFVRIFNHTLRWTSVRGWIERRLALGYRLLLQMQ